MYKITLYDYNCCPICDGTVSFFSENIDDFQEKWFTLEGSEERKERFLRSKKGEMVTDYYSDSPELNIVQYENDKIFARENVTVTDRTFNAVNAYACEETYHIDRMDIGFMWIEFNGEYIRIATYKAIGASMRDPFWNCNREVDCYGNPVLINEIRYEPVLRDYVRNSIDISNHPDFACEKFKDNTITTICYLANQYFDTEEELLSDSRDFQVNDEVLGRLFADVIGEAG